MLGRCAVASEMSQVSLGCFGFCKSLYPLRGFVGAFTKGGTGLAAVIELCGFGLG